jgi:peptidoglycan LD-endopeptidase LytH
MVATAVPGSPTPESAANGPPELHGFAFPIAGACLPEGNQLMPNSPREYRRGVHEGVDFYDADNCVPIPPGTPVLAVKGGRVVRADSDYRNPTASQMNALLANPTSPQSLDGFRGRQVWIDHGNGVVTRYCHLDSVAQGLKVGDVVQKGHVLGGVGESGTPESVTAPGSEYHLHFEVRVGESFLGAGLPPGEVRALYRTLFGP